MKVNTLGTRLNKNHGLFFGVLKKYLEWSC